MEINEDEIRAKILAQKLMSEALWNAETARMKREAKEINDLCWELKKMCDEAAKEREKNIEPRRFFSRWISNQKKMGDN